MEADDLRRETEEVVRIHGELVRRLGRQGIRDVAELVERYQQLQRTMASLTREELDAALIRIGTLLDQLHLIRGQIGELSRMHQTLVRAFDEVDQPARD
ncbi:MAG: hypothetical protein FJ144_10410 [Deltaproteobacteria bacterium]|nr:hypothetical protein [Deltaproteobacteria bacterium]